MSDPMSNLQIEDVLSSIRRLVAEGDKTRAADASATATPTQDTSTPAGDRLVLTPALRVGAEKADDTRDNARLDAAADTNTQPEAEPAKSVDRASLEATIAELEAAVTAQPDEWEPDGTEAAISASALPTYVSKRLLDQPTDIVFDDEPEEIDAQGAETADVAVLSNPIMPDAAPEEDVIEDTNKPAEALESDEATPAPETPFRHFDRAALSQSKAPIRAQEETAASIPEADYGDDLMEDAAPDPQIDARLNAFLSDEAMLADAGLDEDTLRKLIVGVIREELQGALGERITRNVRKLVRREIHRVLAAQDFD